MFLLRRLIQETGQKYFGGWGVAEMRHKQESKQERKAMNKTSRAVKMIIVWLMIALMGSTVVPAAEIVWTNGLGTRVFTTGVNWIGGNAPGLNDLARIDLSGADTVARPCRKGFFFRNGAES